MKRFDANSFVYLAAEMKRLATHLESDKEDSVRPDTAKSNDAKVLKGHREQLKEAGLQMSLTQLDRLIWRCESERELYNKELPRMVNDLATRIEDECNLYVILILSSREAEYFDPDEPIFGADVVNKFPTDGAFEVDEAGKCLGLGRPTAAVFHLMRVTETGIRAVAACLGIPDPVKRAARNWGAVLKTIKDEIGRRNLAMPVAWAVATDRQFFDEVYVSLDAIRNPWRNATMHVENKYTDDEAEHIFAAVKGFMKKLASRCDESGDPRA